MGWDLTGDTEHNWGFNKKGFRWWRKVVNFPASERRRLWWEEIIAGQEVTDCVEFNLISEEEEEVIMVIAIEDIDR